MGLPAKSWYSMTKEERQAYPKCVVREDLRVTCINRSPDGRCFSNHACVRNATRAGITEAVMLYVSTIQKAQAELIRRLGYESIMDFLEKAK